MFDRPRPTIRERWHHFTWYREVWCEGSWVDAHDYLVTLAGILAEDFTRWVLRKVDPS